MSGKPLEFEFLILNVGHVAFDTFINQLIIDSNMLIVD